MLEDRVRRIHEATPIKEGYEGLSLADAHKITKKLTPNPYNQLNYSRGLIDAGFKTSQSHSSYARGFVPDYVKGKRGEWEVYERSNHTIPLFPEGEVNIQAMAAVYSRTNNDLTQTAVLKVSTNKISKQEFFRDLETLTRHFTERPKVFGFPSKALANPLTHLAVALSGIVAGGIVGDYLYSGALNPIPHVLSPDTEYWGAVISGSYTGELISPVVSWLSYHTSKMMLNRELKRMDGYFAEEDVLGVLQNERTHTIDVTIQRWLIEQLPELGSKFEGYQPGNPTPKQRGALLQLGRYAEEVRRIIKPTLDYKHGQLALIRSVETQLQNVRMEEKTEVIKKGLHPVLVTA